jgi:hypothetical protein
MDESVSVCVMRKSWLLVVAGVAFLVCGCGGSERADLLKEVEGWIFTRYAGSITGGAAGQFDGYVGEFLSDSQWSEINPALHPGYSKQDDGDTYVTWYGVVSWMTAQGFSSDVIDTLKDRFASNERAVYFYETEVNGNRAYRWVRFVKN